MRRFTKVNKIIIHTLLLGFIFIGNLASAQVSNNNKNELYTPVETIQINSKPYENLLPLSSFNTGVDSLLIKSSQIDLLNSQYYTNLNNIFIICDQKYLYKDTECNYDYIVTQGSNRIDFYKSNNQELFISFYRGDPNYYLIPEQYVLTPKYNNGLSKLFNSINNASESIINHNLSIENENKNILKINQLLDNTLIEVFLYVTTGFLFVIFTIRPMNVLVRNGFYLIKYNFKDNIIKYFLRVKKYNHLFLLFFIFSLLFTACFLVIISVLDTKDYNLGYMLSYLKDSILLRQSGIARVLLLFSLLVTNASLLVYVLLASIDLILVNFINSIKKDFKTNFLKIIFPTLTLLILFVLLIDPELETFNYIFTLSLATLVLIYLKILFNKVEYPILYDKKQKYLLILVHVLIGFLSIYFNSSKDNKVNYNYEELIGLRDSVISLPYNKVFPENYLFEPFVYTNTEPLYFNNFKVYDNIFNEIVNKDIKNFDDTGSWEIVIMNNKDYDKFLHKNNIIINKLTTNEFTNYLYFKDIKTNDSLVFDISFNCNQNIDPFTIKASISKSSNVTEIKKEKNVPIFHFPGCKAKQFGDYYISYQFPLLINDNSDFVIELTNLNDSIISDFRVTKNNFLIESVFVNYPKNKPMVISNYVDVDSLSVYSSNLSKNITLNKSEEIDLGLILNNMVIEGHIKSPVLIWSTSDMVLLRNNVFLDI